jgi:hypothetical protein
MCLTGSGMADRVSVAQSTQQEAEGYYEYVFGLMDSVSEGDAAFDPEYPSVPCAVWPIAAYLAAFCCALRTVPSQLGPYVWRHHVVSWAARAGIVHTHRKKQVRAPPELRPAVRGPQAASADRLDAPTLPASGSAATKRAAPRAQRHSTQAVSSRAQAR